MGGIDRGELTEGIFRTRGVVVSIKSKVITTIHIALSTRSFLKKQHAIDKIITTF